MPIESIYPPSPGRLFFALLWNPHYIQLNDLKRRLSHDWGEIQDIYFPEKFPMTQYYQKEMGQNLKRCFLLIEGDFPRESHVFVKNDSMKIERENAVRGQRSVNIDPGIICLEQLLLISTKPYSHRIYVGNKLYVELCYQYANGRYHVLPWTYPDYANEKVIENFQEWRKNITS